MGKKQNLNLNAEVKISKRKEGRGDATEGILMCEDQKHETFSVFMTRLQVE